MQIVKQTVLNQNIEGFELLLCLKIEEIQEYFRFFFWSKLIIERTIDQCMTVGFFGEKYRLKDKLSKNGKKTD